jgi:hypothetical protein
MKGRKFLDMLSIHEILEKVSVPWSYFNISYWYKLSCSEYLS